MRLDPVVVIRHVRMSGYRVLGLVYARYDIILEIKLLPDLILADLLMIQSPAFISRCVPVAQ